MVEFVKCFDCQQVKVECKHPDSLLQSILILEWKWEVNSMELITWIPNRLRKHESFVVVADRLRNVAHVIAGEVY